MSTPKYGLFASGDNSYQQNFHRSRVSPQFQFCSKLDIPYYQIKQVVSKDDIFAIFLCDNSIFLKVKDSDLIEIHPLHQFVKIQIRKNIIFGIDDKGYIYKIDIDEGKEESFKLHRFSQFSLTSTKIAGILSNEKKDCIITEQKRSRSKTIIGDAISVGCTDSHVFISTDKDSSLYIYDVNEETLEKMKIDEKIVSITGSDDFAIFISEVGNVYQYSISDVTSEPIRIFGLPPIVEIAAGPQHCAAISFDGRLFVWGFNPSCQLGIKSDRPLKDPICIVDSDVFAAACGSQNTWVLKKPSKPIRPELMKLNVSETLEDDHKSSSNFVYRSLLFA